MRWGGVACFAVVAFGACAGVPTRPREILPARISIDVWQTWSHRGDRIAFHRRFASHYGPQGLYVISKWGGTPRLLLSGDFLSPSRCRFSPDDEWVVAIKDRQLVLVEVATGATRSPVYTLGEVRSADWSPDGSLIVYAKAGPRGAPPDSGGLFLLDVGSGTTSPLRDSTGGFIFGDPVRWSPDGSYIVLAEGTTTSTRLARIGRDGRGRRVIWERQGEIVDAPQWFQRPARAERGLLFCTTSGLDRTYFINPDGSGLRPFVRDLSVYGAVSPDGEEMCWGLYSPDTLGILAVEKLDDRAGLTRRQLTTWRPPAVTSAER
jgi:WD40 repeat protein